MATMYPPTWERALLLLANEAELRDGALLPTAVSDTSLLARAYAYCAAITSFHSRTFSLTTELLPVEKRRAMRALYAFCRVSDDLVDSLEGGAEEALVAWRREALAPVPPPADLVAVAWADTRARYRIPQRYAEQLIDGIGCDLHPRRYRTFEEVARYAYGVPNPVLSPGPALVG